MYYEPTYLGDIELSEETLEHYGVKGMKWRNKKGKSVSSIREKLRAFRPRNQINGLNVSVNYSEGYTPTKPRSRQRNITGSGTGAYRKGSGLGSGSARSNSASRGVSQVTGGNGSIPGLTLGGISQVTSPRRKKKKKR